MNAAADVYIIFIDLCETAKMFHFFRDKYKTN